MLIGDFEAIISAHFGPDVSRNEEDTRDRWCSGGPAEESPGNPPIVRYGLHVMHTRNLSCYAGSMAFLSTPSDLVRFGRPRRPLSERRWRPAVSR